MQQYSYQATTPLLLNTGGQPTYFMALKDASQLVKMYAMVNVSQYDAVAIGSNVEECVDNYVELLAERGIGMDNPPRRLGETETVTAPSPRSATPCRTATPSATSGSRTPSSTTR